MSAEKKQALRRMRQAAVGALAAAAALCVLGHWLERAYHPDWSYLTAFAEAAMIGGLADWFAVTALFRHPLGIPLWHTAIVPRNKDRFGVALGRFVVENFLTDEVVHPKIARIDLAARFADWLLANRELVAVRTVELLPRVIGTLDDERMRAFLTQQIRGQLRAVEAAPFAAEMLTILTDNDRHKELLRRGMGWLSDWIAENQHGISAEIARELPLPRLEILQPLRKTVAEYAGRKTARKIATLARELSEDPHHPLHERFRVFLDERVVHLKKDPALMEKFERVKLHLIDAPETGAYLATIWDDVKRKMIADAAQPESHLRRAIDDMIGRVAEDLRSDPLLRESINQWLRGILRDTVSRHRLEVTELIAETIRKWDPVDAANRLELEVGKDLQYIRINGAIVGGLAGLFIHAAYKLLA